MCVSSKRFAILLRPLSPRSYKARDGTRQCYQHRRALTTNHLLKKGDPWLTPILPAHSNSSGVPKPHVYDLLNRLNASFARVHRNMAALEQVGIFDPLMMQVLNRQSEQLRAGMNYHLLGAMRRIEERDRERFSQPPNEEIPNP